MDVALEMLANPTAGYHSKQFTKLYNDVISKAKYEDKAIMKSKGDITELKYYENIEKSVGYLGKILNRSNEEYALLERLHKIMISERDSFEFGFKYDIDVIKATYISMTYALVDLISICIIEYASYLKNPGTLNPNLAQSTDVMNRMFNSANPTKDKRGTKSARVVVKSVRKFIKCYDKGDWGKVVSENKKLVSKGALGTAIGWSLVIIAATAAILWTIRGIVYMYYEVAASTQEKVKAMADFVHSVEEEEEEGSVAQVKQERLAKKLDGLSEFLNVKILKADKAATAKLEAADKEYNTSAKNAEKNNDVVQQARNQVELY